MGADCRTGRAQNHELRGKDFAEPVDEQGDVDRHINKKPASLAVCQCAGLVFPMLGEFRVLAGQWAMYGCSRLLWF
jgi:hypothetical protein